MLQEALALLMVVMLGSSMEVFLEKVASNLALMFLRIPPGRNLEGGRVRLMVAFEEEGRA